MIITDTPAFGNGGGDGSDRVAARAEDHEVRDDFGALPGSGAEPDRGGGDFGHEPNGRFGVGVIATRTRVWMVCMTAALAWPRPGGFRWTRWSGCSPFPQEGRRVHRRSDRRLPRAQMGRDFPLRAHAAPGRVRHVLQRLSRTRGQRDQHDRKRPYAQFYELELEFIWDGTIQAV